jgi:sensor histidine kinase YesM
LKKISIHIIALLAGLVIAYLYNFGYAYHLYALIQSESIFEFSSAEFAKLIHTLFWFVSVCLLVYTFILFNYSWKNKFIKDDLKSWKKNIYNIAANLLFYLLFAIIALLVSTVFLVDFGKNSFILLLSKFSFAAIPAIIIASILLSYKNSKWNEKLIAQLKLEKRNSELQGLKEQLSPHFFFNTLNTLSSLIRTGDKSDSLEFVDSLSDVYRYILDSQTNDTVKISEEIDFVKSYMFLLKKRFGNSIEYCIDINSQMTDKYIPPLSIQILIENAVKHNVFTERQPLIVRIEQQIASIIVTNNMHSKSNSEGHGIGLSNLNKRIQLLVGKEIIIHSDQSTFSVSIPIKV